MKADCVGIYQHQPVDVVTDIVAVYSEVCGYSVKFVYVKVADKPLCLRITETFINEYIGY